MLCQEWCLVNHQRELTTCITMYCNSWKCPVCQPRRAARLVMQARGGKPNTFITLTVNPTVGASPNHRASLLAWAWRIARKRAMRKYGYRHLPFIAVFEKTKRGEPHLHILARSKWIDQRWLSAQMRELIGAPIVDVRRIQSAKRLARYVSKYVGKDPHRFGTTKRYWTSQDWSSWRRDRDDDDNSMLAGWSIHKLTAGQYADHMGACGWEVTPVRGGYELRHETKKYGFERDPPP